MSVNQATPLISTEQSSVSSSSDNENGELKVGNKKLRVEVYKPKEIRANNLLGHNGIIILAIAVVAAGILIAVNPSLIGISAAIVGVGSMPLIGTMIFNYLSNLNEKRKLKNEEKCTITGQKVPPEDTAVKVGGEIYGAEAYVDTLKEQDKKGFQKVLKLAIKQDLLNKEYNLRYKEDLGDLRKSLEYYKGIISDGYKNGYGNMPSDIARGRRKAQNKYDKSLNELNTEFLSKGLAKSNLRNLNFEF